MGNEPSTTPLSIMMTERQYLERSKKANVPNHCPLYFTCPKAQADLEHQEEPDTELIRTPYLFDWCPEVVLPSRDYWFTNVAHYLDCPLFSKWWWETAIQKGRPRLPIRAGITNRIRYQVFKRDNFVCQYCGRKPPEVSLEVDHRIPASKGGADDFDNLITACKDCNRGKSDDLPSESGLGKVNSTAP